MADAPALQAPEVPQLYAPLTQRVADAGTIALNTNTVTYCATTGMTAAANYYVYVDTTDNGTTNAVTNTEIWEGWTNGTIGAGATRTAYVGVQDQVMRRWVQQAAEFRERVEYRVADMYPPQREPTPEELAAREVQAAAERVAQEARRAEYAAVESRALATMLRFLSKPQRAEWNARERFFVTTPDGRLFLIRKGSHGNVFHVERETGKYLRAFCGAPAGVPWPDAMLGQKLTLETDPEAYIAKANASVPYEVPPEARENILRALAEAA